MDRLYIMQKEYADADRDPSALLYKAALSEFCPRHLDRWITYGEQSWEGMSEALADEVRVAYANGASAVIPVGTIPFVREFLAAHALARPDAPPADPAMTPLEVPAPLLPYAGREYSIKLGKDIPAWQMNADEWFFKDAGNLKSWTSALYSGDISGWLDDETPYVVSGEIDIGSEWRVFVMDDEILSVNWYSGDPARFPDPGTLHGMVSAYAQAEHPLAYTLDVAVCDGATLPIEVHPFAACGLYGFYDPYIPDMLEKGFGWYLGN